MTDEREGAEPDDRAASPPRPPAEPATGRSGEGGTGAVPEATDPDEARRLARRRFFRSMAADAMRTASALAGAAGALRSGTQEVAAALIAAAADGMGSDPAGAGGAVAVTPAPSAPTLTVAPSAITAQQAVGFRSPFRQEGDRLILLDQRRLPELFVEVECRTGAEVSQCIREGIVRGAPLLGQVAAAGLALTATAAAMERPFARRAIIHGTANALVGAAPTAAPVRTAADRMLARLEAVGDVAADGPAVVAAFRAEADAVIEEASLAHAAICRHGVAALPERPGATLRVLTFDDTGPLSSGLVGTALGVALQAAGEGREIHVWVMESRPGFEGSRLAAWTLAQSGVPHTVIADAAAGTLFASDQVDVVLVGADRLAVSGDLIARAGMYGLAILAGAHEIPFLVAAPLAAYDPPSEDLVATSLATRSAVDVLFARDGRIAPIGTGALNPAADAVPADLVTAIITEAGALRPPLAQALALASDERRGHVSAPSRPAPAAS